MNGTMVQEPTDKQLDYLSGLLDEAARLLDERARVTGCEWPEARTEVARMSGTDDRTRTEVSALIDTARRNNQALRTELAGYGQPSGGQAPEEFVATGMYRVGERVFKVLPSRSSDRHYAKELTGSRDDGFTFEYAKGAMYLIRDEHRMTLEQAAEFGKLTGSCCCCGRLLTDPQSISAGIGPVCKGKNF